MSDQTENELSAGARALIDEVRDLDGPAPGDRDRVKRALVAAIAGGASLAASTAASTAAAGTTAATATAAAGGLSLGVKIAAVALVAAALGGTALVVTAPPEPAPARRAAVHAPARPAEPAILRPAIEPDPPAIPAPEAVAAPVAEAPPPEVAAPAEAPQVAPRVRRAPATPLEIARADSTLTEELALLRDAQRAMQADRPHDALSRLDEHARRFPTGVLEEEREAARVLALCRADRAGEARALAERFLRERPSSPHRARVRAACP